MPEIEYLSYVNSMLMIWISVYVERKVSWQLLSYHACGGFWKDGCINQCYDMVSRKGELFNKWIFCFATQEWAKHDYSLIVGSGLYSVISYYYLGSLLISRETKRQNNFT